MDLATLREFIGECTRCKLAPKRTNIVFGVGNPKAELMFIGASEKPEQELGIVFKPDHETLHSADVFKDLKLPREIAREPLLEGEWA